MPKPASIKNLEGGVGKGGRTLQDIWRSKGFSEEEIARKTADRIELIRAVKARNWASRNGKEVSELFLGEGVTAAYAIHDTKKALNKEFRQSPLKGVKHQSTILKEQQRRQRAADRHREAIENPKVRGLQGVPGLTLDEDGTIGLAELKRQRPDFVFIKEEPSAEMIRIHNEKVAKGHKDKKRHARYFTD